MVIWHNLVGSNLDYGIVTLLVLIVSLYDLTANLKSISILIVSETCWNIDELGERMKDMEEE